MPRRRQLQVRGREPDLTRDADDHTTECPEVCGPNADAREPGRTEQRLSGDAPPERTRTNGEGGQAQEQEPRAKGTCEHAQRHTGEPQCGATQEERRPRRARRDEARGEPRPDAKDQGRQAAEQHRPDRSVVLAA